MKLKSALGRNIFKMLTRVHFNRLKDTLKHQNTVIVLICSQKNSEKIYRKVNVKNKALCDTQHVSLLFKIVSQHTDKIMWLVISWLWRDSILPSIHAHPHPSTPYTQTERNQPTKLEILSNCTDVGRADAQPNHCASLAESGNPWWDFGDAGYFCSKTVFHYVP